MLLPTVKDHQQATIVCNSLRVHIKMEDPVPGSRALHWMTLPAGSGILPVPSILHISSLTTSTARIACARSHILPLYPFFECARN